eukprot:m51a1_g462 putative alpha-1,3/1,6-mannosyltransferase (410) ;mRNA; f:171568-173460
MPGLRVAFLHPDLGIGGAERLVVDAALALKSKGCDVHMFTSHHDPAHCFEETRDGSLPVHVAGDWLPRNLFGLCHILFAALRALWLGLYFVRTSRGRNKFDVVVVDQVSAAVPLVKAWTRSRVLFYCHFPDKLLSPRGGALRRLYRRPFDWLEESTTAKSDRIVVNSRFTAGIFAKAFPSIRSEPSVIYPSINTAQYDSPPPAGTELPGVPTDESVPVVVSINRFERKKDVGLALEALSALRGSGALPRAQADRVRLVLAGGYDPRVAENAEVFSELQQRAGALGLSDRVVFLPNFTAAQRNALLRRADALVYTPANEHFGIVPVEAMYMRVPVVAVRSGGPLESVRNGETGFLCDASPEAFGAALAAVIRDPQRAREMGEAGRRSVQERFSFDAFAGQLYECVRGLCD